jgi:hypothetical protein
VFLGRRTFCRFARGIALTRLISVPAHGKESAVEKEEVLEDQLAAEGLRGRVTITNQLSDRQVKSLIPVIVQIRVAQLYIKLSRKGNPTVLTMLDGILLPQDEVVSHARTISSMSGVGSGKAYLCLCFLQIFHHLMSLEN